MEIITSFTNKTVKRFKLLEKKKYRDQSGEFVIEGYKNVLDSASARPDAVKLIALSESAYREHGGQFSDFPTVVLSDEVADRLSETSSGQGYFSINAIKQSCFPEQNCILLDRVRDPGNVGTILRTAVAAGYDAVLCGCCDVYSPKVVRSSMSAILKCRMSFDLPQSELKKAGYELIVADMSGKNVFSADKPAGKYCIVIGNEAEGVSEELKNAADRTLAIPQRGIESLNAAVAAGIMMFALANENG